MSNNKIDVQEIDPNKLIKPAAQSTQSFQGDQPDKRASVADVLSVLASGAESFEVPSRGLLSSPATALVKEITGFEEEQLLTLRSSLGKKLPPVTDLLPVLSSVPAEFQPKLDLEDEDQRLLLIQSLISGFLVKTAVTPPTNWTSVDQSFLNMATFVKSYGLTAVIRCPAGHTFEEDISKRVAWKPLNAEELSSFLAENNCSLTSQKTLKFSIKTVDLEFVIPPASLEILLYTGSFFTLFAICLAKVYSNGNELPVSQIKVDLLKSLPSRLSGQIANVMSALTLGRKPDGSLLYGLNLPEEFNFACPAHPSETIKVKALPLVYQFRF